MKKIRTIIVCFSLMCICCIVHAQEYTPLYDEKPDFSLFEGIWKYQTESEEFVLKLKSCQYEFKGKNKFFVLGVFKYVKNGKEVYNYLNLSEKISSAAHKGVVRMFRIADLPSTEQHFKVRIMFNDPKTINKTKSWMSTMEIIPGNPIKAVWHIEPDMWERDLSYEDNEGNTYVISDPQLLDGFTIPTDMILTKVE